MSERTTQLLEAATGRTFPGCEAVGTSVADGGEGATDAVISVLNGIYRRLAVHGPLAEEAQSFYREFGGDSAIIEIAAASGFPMVLADRRNPLNVTTYGAEELIGDALDRGYRKIFIAIGDGVTNDGGMGAMHALGVRFLDDQGSELGGRGRDLARVADVDMSRMYPAVVQTGLTAICGATSPLMGPDGATYTFGKQKGDTPEILDMLEGGMIRYTVLLKKKLGADMGKIPGAGVTGGLGTAFCAFLKASLKSGIDAVLDLIHFDSLLEGVDLAIIKGGRMDWQSAFGKVSSGIEEHYRERGIPVAVIVGSMGDEAKMIFDYGIDSIMTTINGAMGIEEAPERTEELYISAADHTFRMLRTGMSLGQKRTEAGVT